MLRRRGQPGAPSLTFIFKDKIERASKPEEPYFKERVHYFKSRECLSWLTGWLGGGAKDCRDPGGARVLSLLSELMATGNPGSGEGMGRGERARGWKVVSGRLPLNGKPGASPDVVIPEVKWQAQ